jgi:tetratricopeptide (TPR) repeat protein
VKLTLSFVRSSLVVTTLVIGGGAFVVTALPSAAIAAKKKPKKGGQKGGRDDDDAPKRSIKKEESLAPKKEVNIDEEISKTKDFKPADVGGNRPTLTPDELKRATTEQLMEDKLDEEIELAKKLLELETECDSASPVRFRLADLYWEKAKRAFFKSQDFSTAEGERRRWEDLSKKLQDATIKHYTKIVDDCEGYKDYSKVLFYLGKALAEVDRAKDGAGYLKRIIKEFPESEWLASAWFMVGEYYFNNANDALAALKAYKKATEVPKSNVYAFAVYKQGWCYINTGDWDQALERFDEVVTASEDPQQELDPKGRASLRREALKDYVRAYSHVGKSEQALKTFYKAAGKDAKDMVPQMMEWLGSWYIQQGAHQETIDTYTSLIKSYRRSTRLPIFQGRVVDASSRLGDKKSTVAQVKLLTDYFGEIRERVKKGDLNNDEKKTIDKDMREAEDIAENTLRRLATEYYKEAKKLRGNAEDRTYRFALDLFRHYLTVFPEPKKDADVNYVFFMRFYYADILARLEEFLEAAKNYDMVVDMNPHPKKETEKQIVLAAAEESVRNYDELVQDLDRKSPPEISGTEPKQIPKIKQDLIASCQRYIEYVGDQGDKIVPIRYKMARIYYTYNHFDKAAPAFNDIVKNHPENEVACYSANLALDIYNGKKDYKALRETSHAYLENKKLACGDEDRQKFAKIEESSSFLLVKTEYEDKKRYVAAANAYLQFYKDYPKSEFADDAVYNAAVNYDLGNRLDKANETRKFLVDKLPDSPLVPDTLYNIALSYERIVDFENAAQNFELFARRYPDDKRSKDAVYNAGLYRATLRDYAGGKNGRELFIKKYPGDPEVHNVFFSICEMLEEEAENLEAAQKAGKANQNAALQKWTEAHDCYEKFVKNPLYARADQDLVCHAQFRRGEIMRQKTNYDKGYADQKKLLLGNWPQWKKAAGGVDKLPRCAAAIAEIEFRDLDPRMKKYKDITLAEFNPATEAAVKRFKASVASKIKERDELVGQYRAVAEIGVAEWALASLYDIGELYRDSIQKLLEAPIPDKIQGQKLSAEDKQIARDQLKNEAAPIEESAVEAYRLCVQKANELGVYNKWSVRALDQLNKLRPEEYPLVTERIAALEFKDKLVVAENSVVVLDGDSYKSADVQVTTGVGKPPAAKPAPPAAPPSKAPPAGPQKTGPRADAGGAP